jgi:hypothetical protein
VPVPRISNDRSGELRDPGGAELALDGIDHRLEMTEVRGVDRDLRSEDDLLLVDCGLHVVPLLGRLTLGSARSASRDRWC